LVVEVVLDLLEVVLSLLDEFSDALANRAAAMAGPPASERTTGTAINQHPNFTNLFIISSPLRNPRATSNDLTFC